MTPGQHTLTLAKIRKQADAATEGPWHHQRGHGTPSGWQDACVLDADGEYVISEVSDNNAEFIAASRTTVPALAGALESILERHVKSPPILAAYGTHEGGDYCAACAEDWPCPDYTVITTALEGLHND